MDDKRGEAATSGPARPRPPRGRSAGRRRRRQLRVDLLAPQPVERLFAHALLVVREPALADLAPQRVLERAEGVAAVERVEERLAHPAFLRGGEALHDPE